MKTNQNVITTKAKKRGGKTCVDHQTQSGIMNTLFINNVPFDVQEWLIQEARANKLTIDQQAVLLLKASMPKFSPVSFGDPVIPRQPISAEFIEGAIKEGRK